MCDLDVDLESLCAERGASAAAFEPELERLVPFERDGLVQGSGYRIQVTENGRPFLRSVAAVFDRYLHAWDERHTQSL
jgi:oxygen-independent coproporphyrinogen-3 oxidase